MLCRPDRGWHRFESRQGTVGRLMRTYHIAWRNLENLFDEEFDEENAVALGPDPRSQSGITVADGKVEPNGEETGASVGQG